MTKELHNVATTLIPGQTQSLALSQLPQVRTEPLLTAINGYWGETKYQDMETTGVSFDSKEDFSAPPPGPRHARFTGERGHARCFRCMSETSRMVVVGNGDFIEDARSCKMYRGQCRLYHVHALNWLMGREERIGITPKEEKQFTIDLSDEQMFRIMMLTMGVMPVSVLMIGTLSGCACAGVDPDRGFLRTAEAEIDHLPPAPGRRAVFLHAVLRQSNLPTTQEKEELNKHVVNMDRDKIDGITIANNETKIELRKEERHLD